MFCLSVFSLIGNETFLQIEKKITIAWSFFQQIIVS